MKQPLKKYLILSATIIIMIFIVAIIDGYWPVAFAGFSPVYYQQFNNDYVVSYNYYADSLKAENQDISVLKTDTSVKELKRAVLESLVEQKIIENELAKSINGNDLSRMIQDKLDSAGIASDNFKKGAKLLYGLSADDFKKSVLIPRAEREILENRLISENLSLDGWLKDQKSSMKVYVLIKGFAWADGGIIAK